MQPQDFAQAAAGLRAGAALVDVPGFPSGLGQGMAALAALAAGCSHLFLARPPMAPGAVLCGASHAPQPGLRAHAAGLGPTPQTAFARAMGEVAETRALYRDHGDPRIDMAGTLPLLDAELRPSGRIPAHGLLREAGRNAHGNGLGAGHDATMAASAAWREAVERHAIAVWFHNGAPAVPLPSPAAAQRLESALRRNFKAEPLRYLLLPGAVPGLVVVVALSEGTWGCLPGYGCATTAAEAACKAATEAVMGEFALYLEHRARIEEGRAPPAQGFAARAAMLATRTDLTQPPAGGALMTGAARQPAFADLTIAGDGLVVLRSVTPGLLYPDETPGPV